MGVVQTLQDMGHVHLTVIKTFQAGWKLRQGEDATKTSRIVSY